MPMIIYENICLVAYCYTIAQYANTV